MGEAPFDFAATFRRLRNKSCHVHDVQIAGNERTHARVLLRELKPVSFIFLWALNIVIGTLF